MLGAVVAGMRAATYEPNDPLVDGYMIGMDAPYTMSVFAVRCDKVEKDPFVAIYYDYTLSVERAICYCGWGYPVPETIQCATSLVNDDGTPLMEEGKTYLIRGNCGPHTADPDYFGLASFDFLDGKGDDGFQWDPDSGIKYLKEDIFPLCTPYTGDLDDFLASEAGALWREDIIPTVERVYSTAKLILTDNVYSIYQFNKGSATILEGRAISEEEYAQGANVCLVSQQYAKKNGLTVGDALSMELYKPSVSYANEFQWTTRET